MIDVLTMTLKYLVLPERLRLYIQIIELLTAYNSRDHEFELLQVLNTADVLESDAIISAVHSILRVAITNLLRAHGVRARDHDLSVLIDLVVGLKEIEDRTDHEDILTILEDDSDPTMAFSNVVEHITGRSWAEISPIIDYVDPELIRRIVELHTINQDDVIFEDPTLFLDTGTDEVDDKLPDEKPIEKSEIVGRLKHYLKKVPFTTLIETMITENGYSTGHSLDTYIENNITVLEKPDQGNRFTEKRILQIAQEVLSMALASSIKMNKIRDTVEESLESIYDDVQTMTAINIAVGNEFGKAVTYYG